MTGQLFEVDGKNRFMCGRCDLVVVFDTVNGFLREIEGHLRMHPRPHDKRPAPGTCAYCGESTRDVRRDLAGEQVCTECAPCCPPCCCDRCKCGCHS